MTTETTYNPVLPPTALDRASDFYWSNRTLCDTVMFVGTLTLVVRVLVAMA